MSVRHPHPSPCGRGGVPLASRAAAPYAGSTPPWRREREKERMKLWERHHRSITSRMLAGLRQHGNFPFPARAGMNDVLAALARAAGWTVQPDGTTFRSSPQVLPAPPPQLGAFYPTPADTPTLTNTLNSYAIGIPLDSQASALHTDDSLSPSSLDSVGVAVQSIKNDNYGNSSPVNSLNCMDNDQLMRSSAVLVGDYTRTLHIYQSMPLFECSDLDPDFVPCSFKEWIDKRNFTETERQRSFRARHLSECQGNYLQELENERRRRSTERAQRIWKIRSKEYDLRLYEHVVRKDEENLKAREKAIKQREELLSLKEEEVQKREQDLKLKEEEIQRFSSHTGLHDEAITSTWRRNMFTWSMSIQGVPPEICSFLPSEHH